MNIEQEIDAYLLGLKNNIERNDVVERRRPEKAPHRRRKREVRPRTNDEYWNNDPALPPGVPGSLFILPNKYLKDRCYNRYVQFDTLVPFIGGFGESMGWHRPIRYFMTFKYMSLPVSQFDQDFIDSLVGGQVGLTYNSHCIANFSTQNDPFTQSPWNNWGDYEVYLSHLTWWPDELDHFKNPLNIVPLTLNRENYELNSNKWMMPYHFSLFNDVRSDPMTKVTVKAMWDQTPLELNGEGRKEKFERIIDWEFRMWASKYPLPLPGGITKQSSDQEVTDWVGSQSNLLFYDGFFSGKSHDFTDVAFETETNIRSLFHFEIEEELILFIKYVRDHSTGLNSYRSLI